MKGILINALDRTVELVSNAGDLAALYDGIKCEMVEIADFNPETGDTVWVDEEGLLKDNTYGFVYKNKKLMGNGMIYGSNLNGDNVDVSITVEDVITELLFFRLEPEAI